MCTLSKGVMEKGMAKGMEAGLMKGRAEGCADGILRSLRGLMKTTGFTVEQAMAALDVPEAERPKYRELLKAQ